MTTRLFLDTLFFNWDSILFWPFDFERLVRSAKVLSKEMKETFGKFEYKSEKEFRIVGWKFKENY